jgi:hypothetical protein
VCLNDYYIVKISVYNKVCGAFMHLHLHYLWYREPIVLWPSSTTIASKFTRDNKTTLALPPVNLLATVVELGHYTMGSLEGIP